MRNRTYPTREVDNEGAGFEPQFGPVADDDPILREHLEKALGEADDDRVQYHLRAALQRLEIEFER